MKKKQDQIFHLMGGGMVDRKGCRHEESLNECCCLDLPEASPAIVIGPRAEEIWSLRGAYQLSPLEEP